MNEIPSPSSLAAAPRVVHEPLLPLYASQFVLLGNDEHLVIDCAPAVLSDQRTGQPSLPVHTRLVLSWSGAQRLAALLAQALKQHAAGPAQPAGRPAAALPASAPLAAQLPRLEA
jgi:hypothetical protein